MTANDVLRRLMRLKEPLCDRALLVELYGEDVLDTRVEGAWRSWARRGAARPRPTTVGDGFHRFSLETFFQQERLLPTRWAAARLGMTPDSFLEVLAYLRDRGRLPLWATPEPLVPDRLVREFAQLFPSLQSTLFGSHDALCRAVHRALLDDGGPVVSALKCVSAPLLGHDDYAAEFDAVTGDPIGLRYQLWLATGKPMNLRPDGCSWKLYIEHRDVLEKWLFPGVTVEDIPRELLVRSA